MFRTIAMIVAIAAGFPSARAGTPVEPGLEMREAANNLIAGLDADQRKRACFPFGSDERENWAFVPKQRAGIPLSDLTPAQRDLVTKLLGAALSEKGLLKVDTIIALEGLLGEMEKRPDYRDSTKYHTSIFGDPGKDGPWGWRFEGHHLSVNLTIVPGKGISAAPSFMGANPAEVREGAKKGTRPLAAEEDLARVLAASLDGAGGKVVFTDKPPGDILTGSDRKAKQLEPVGIPAKEMTAAQQTALKDLIREYAGRFRKEVAEGTVKRIEAEFETVRFGWAGSLKPGEAYYYRVQGKSFLIEAANSQNNANHIHTVWRDVENDFGRDALGEHYQSDDHSH